MSSPSMFTQVRTAIATQIAAAMPGVLNVYPYAPGQITSPALIVALPENWPYHGTMGTWAGILDWRLFLYVNAGAPQIAEATLESFLDGGGANSVFAALYADKTLGGILGPEGLSITKGEYLGTTTYGAGDPGPIYEVAMMTVSISTMRSA